MAPRADYGGRVVQVTGGGVIATVVDGGPAARAGLAVGQTVRTVDGEKLRDVIDWQWLADGASATLLVSSAEGEEREVGVTREPGESWGLTFTETVFDGVRTCRNNCAFCFMTQLPKGLRPALYLRDDDYRLSFLQGNFVTLTNLTDGDVDRIIEQRLTPLYVSLHAVDTDVREQLVCAKDDRALERFDQLLDGDIELHVQIVLVPDVNDGEVLDRTLTWLAEREGVASVGIVPLGYTMFQGTFNRSYQDPDASFAVIEQVAPWQDAFRERDGVSWVYLADEFYLSARTMIPSADSYDGYPQYENGIGLVRSFADEFVALGAELLQAVAELPPTVAVGVATGYLFAPVLEELLALVDTGGQIHVIAIDNTFFGGNVSVTGLLTGKDLVSAIRQDRTAAVVLVPSIVANADDLLLDDMPSDQLCMRSVGSPGTELEFAL